MHGVIIFDGIRTPFGRRSGALAAVRADDLAALPLTALLTRNSLPGDLVDDVILGNTNQAGEDSRNLARNAALIAGFSPTVSGVTVNRLCGSGLEALAMASRCIALGDANLLIAGGAESMSRAPLVLSKASTAYDSSQQLVDSSLGWRFPHPDLLARYGAESMAETADNIAREMGIGRDETDAYALRSQQAYQAAFARGFFDGEIMPVTVPIDMRGGPILTIADDEHPRAGTKLDSLARLPTLYPEGVTTAGNASGVNDGAVALLLGSLEIGKRYGLLPRARILGSAVTGVAPRLMGLGPVDAIDKVLQRTGLSLADMAVIEINEAFSAQVLGCLYRLELEPDDPRVNPNGGAVALGHPLGASGARLALTALRQLEATQGRYAVVSLCIGVGQGIALVMERL